ncbi:calcium-binding protein [Tateyamaria sp. ANG-S1]|uniref:calcium-binding protein n=1 Tax=Tateyamaria sp. ANG-S1 TaxID=1577905 RepID=UPI0006922ABC|nr:calcium-binding protein [Tateyamaria sp. ANG-S1]
MTEILGTPGNDSLVGTEGDDIINSGLGDDTVIALGGDDFIAFSGSILSAGSGNDTVAFSGFTSLDDMIDGGDGFDRFVVTGGGPGSGMGLGGGTFSGFERIDLNEVQLVLTADNFLGVSQVTGFGGQGALVFAAMENQIIDLSSITVGERGTGIGRAEIQMPVPVTAGMGAVLDASGATSDWELRSDRSFNDITLLGGAGNDTLRGDVGDTLRGGDGDDRFVVDGSFSNLPAPSTTIEGGAGIDTLEAIYGRYYQNLDLSGIEVLQGGGAFFRNVALSFDQFTNFSGITFLGTGEINLNGRVQSVALNAQGQYQMVFRTQVAGNDDFTLTDHWGRVNVDMGLGDDTVRTGDGNDHIFEHDVFGGGNDLFMSGDGHDTLNGGDGDDTLIAWGTDNDVSDFVRGGFGNDSIETGAGNDEVFGDVGNDTIDAGDGSDTVNGGSGDDVIVGGTSANDISDVLSGSFGNDLIRGGAGNDMLRGDSGNDTLEGETGADTLIGGDGNDDLSGGALADVLIDGAGDDFLNGGFGSDLINLVENGGADRIFHAGATGHGSDWVAGFQDQDTLVFGGAGQASDFQVNRANTADAGDANVDELFVTYVPSGQILWALVDGDDLTALNLQIADQTFDLLA